MDRQEATPTCSYILHLHVYCVKDLHYCDSVAYHYGSPATLNNKCDNPFKDHLQDWDNLLNIPTPNVSIVRRFHCNYTLLV